jgi:hypothetical protein
MPAIGELVRSTTGQWMGKPPLHCPRGHRLRPGHTLVGSIACSCGRHLTWRCQRRDHRRQPMSVACVTSSYGTQKEPSGRRSERCQQQNGHDGVPSQTPPIGLQRIDSRRRAAIGAIAAPVLPTLRHVYQASLCCEVSVCRSCRRALRWLLCRAPKQAGASSNQFGDVTGCAGPGGFVRRVRR